MVLGMRFSKKKHCPEASFWTMVLGKQISQKGTLSRQWRWATQKEHCPDAAFWTMAFGHKMIAGIFNSPFSADNPKL